MSLIICTYKSQNEVYYLPFWLFRIISTLKKHKPGNTLSYPVISYKKKMLIRKKTTKEPF